MQIAYDSLPVAEKKAIARELRPSTPIPALAELLKVGTSTIARWTVDIVVDLRRSRPPVRVLTDEDYCDCPHPFTDSRMNSFCKRSEHCAKCGKPGRA